MPSAKHGRLFTEADVRGLITLALTHPQTMIAGTVIPIRDIADAVLNGEYSTGPLTFPADEPLFLLRGQDFYAPDAVADYRDALDMVPDAVGVEHREAVHVAYVEMNDWQSRHPDRVKPPD